MHTLLNSLLILLSYLLKSQPTWPDGPIKQDHPVEEARHRLGHCQDTKSWHYVGLEMDAQLVWQEKTEGLNWYD